MASAASSIKYKLSSELDQIYFISSNREDDNYDSIEVIDERRMKNLPKSEKARLYKSNTFICEEYYSNTPIQSKQQPQQPQITTTAIVERSADTDAADNEPATVDEITTDSELIVTAETKQ